MPFEPVEQHMAMAVREAELAMEQGEVPTGCVITRLAGSGRPQLSTVVGKAHNQVETLHDATAHAEMIAITQASSAIGDWRLTDTAIYITKEPCPMCAGAILRSRIPYVVYGISDPKGGAVSIFNMLDRQELNHRCKVYPGILAEESRSLLQHFFQTRRK